MIKSAVFIYLSILAFCHVNGEADLCDPSTCSIDDNCRCSSTQSPLPVEDTPQLIVLAFVDAARSDLYTDFWAPLAEPRKNPDGEFISATFYIPHEYTDYSIVHDLAAVGFEIGIHSVTNNPLQSYWREASQELLEQEFGDQKKIIAKFANLPDSAIAGALTPQLQLAGDNSIRAFISQGISYDNSWPSKEKLFPYTLDYASSQQCDNGANCPKDSHAGFWITPIVDLYNEIGRECATVAGCFGNRNNQTADEITEWLLDEVNAVKNTNRAPITLILEENLFKSVNESWAGINAALDVLEADPEVFFVSQSRVIEWMKNPEPISEFQTNPVIIETGCVKEVCTPKNEDGQDRYMVTCVPCPPHYPWLGNPEGN